MERKPKSDSYRRAVQAAQNIIKSRTGNAIMKQAYGAADRQAEKKARLIEHKKGKELRKLALEKVQFIHEQDEKLKKKEPEKTRAKNSDGIQTILEIRIPSEKDFAEDENCKENLVSRRSPRTVRSSPRKEQCRTVGSSKQKKNQPGEIFPTQIESMNLSTRKMVKSFYQPEQFVNLTKKQEGDDYQKTRLSYEQQTSTKITIKSLAGLMQWIGDKTQDTFNGHREAVEKRTKKSRMAKFKHSSKNTQG